MSSFAEAADRLTIGELQRRGSLKWTRGGPGVLGAFVAEMDFGTAPAVEAALREVMACQEYGYLSDQASAELSQACADRQLSAYGWPADPARIWPMPDVFRSLVAVITAFSRPGSPVILPTPAYMPFVELPAQLGRATGGYGGSSPREAAAACPVRVDLRGGRRARHHGGLRLQGVEPARPEVRPAHLH